jgi:hypothetical protein
VGLEIVRLALAGRWFLSVAYQIIVYGVHRMPKWHRSIISDNKKTIVHNLSQVACLSPAPIHRKAKNPAFARSIGLSEVLRGVDIELSL